MSMNAIQNNCHEYHIITNMYTFMYNMYNIFTLLQFINLELAI